jgi:nucleotide-binding universal stress UspA family protein
MRRILIPLNISEISPEILPVVRRLFNKEDVELILLGVTQRPGSYVAADACIPDAPHTAYTIPCTDDEWKAYRQKFEVELKHLAETLRQEDYRVHTLVRIGDPVEQIVATVEKGAYDLLAMATRGRTGLTRLVLGSVAESVLRQVTIPMLLIRPAPETVAKAQKVSQAQASFEPTQPVPIAKITHIQVSSFPSTM